MPIAEPAGTTLFLKRWLRRPLSMGAVVPSGRLLAEALAQTTLSAIQGREGHVIELGAGTGEVTKALLAAGIPGERLALVERDTELAAFLRRRFREPSIIEGDAARLREREALRRGGSDGRGRCAAHPTILPRRTDIHPTTWGSGTTVVVPDPHASRSALLRRRSPQPVTARIATGESSLMTP